MLWVFGALALAGLGWGLYRYQSKNSGGGADSSTSWLGNGGSSDSASGDSYSSDAGGGDSGGSE